MSLYISLISRLLTVLHRLPQGAMSFIIVIIATAPDDNPDEDARWLGPLKSSYVDSANNSIGHPKGQHKLTVSLVILLGELASIGNTVAWCSLGAPARPAIRSPTRRETPQDVLQYRISGHYFSLKTCWPENVQGQETRCGR